jgi:hypothetical protein
MAHTALTVIAPIRKGANLQRLQRVLGEIGDDVYCKKKRGGHIHFPDIPELHFSRVLLIKDPDRGPDRIRLLFAAIIDGDDRLGFYRRLRDATTKMKAIWGECVDYPGPDDFPSWMVDQNLEPSAFYIAFKGQTVQTVRNYEGLRDRLENLLDRRGNDRHSAPPTHRRRRMTLTGIGRWLESWITWFFRLGPQLLATYADADRIIRRHRFFPTWNATTMVSKGLNRYPGWRFFNYLIGNVEHPVRGLRSQAQIDKVHLQFPPEQVLSVVKQDLSHPHEEDRITQNQLTLITPIGTPAGANHLGSALGAVDSYSRVWAKSGSLLGMSTIHFVRWMPIDHDSDGVPRRFLMLSDYDNAWDAYIEEFVEMIRTGMDAMWTSINDAEGNGYLKAGSYDVAAFKQFLRAHQINASIFYSAYPHQTVLNITEDRGIFSGLEPDTSDADLLSTVDRRQRNALP